MLDFENIHSAAVLIAEKEVARNQLEEAASEYKESSRLAAKARRLWKSKKEPKAAYEAAQTVARVSAQKERSLKAYLKLIEQHISEPVSSAAMNIHSSVTAGDTSNPLLDDDLPRKKPRIDNVDYSEATSTLAGIASTASHLLRTSVGATSVDGASGVLGFEMSESAVNIGFTTSNSTESQSALANTLEPVKDFEHQTLILEKHITEASPEAFKPIPDVDMSVKPPKKKTKIQGEWYIPKSVTLWHNLNDAQKKRLIRVGKLAYNAYLHHGTPLPYPVRLWARCESSYMPALANHSRKLAIMCFKTRVGNLICPYHTRHDGAKGTNDFLAQGSNAQFLVTGIPYPRTMVVSKALRIVPEVEESDNEEDPSASEVGVGLLGQDDPVAMSCGCLLDDVLLDFHIWKSTVIASPSTEVKNEAYKADVLNPRHRAFQCEALRKIAGLSLNSVYIVNKDGKEKSDKEWFAVRQRHVKQIDTYLDLIDMQSTE